MARTRAGAVLTEGHRLAQLGILGTFMDSFVDDWSPDMAFDGAAFVAWLSMIAPEVSAAYGLSAEAATRYYAMMRSAEGVTGDYPTPVTVLPDVDGIIAGLMRYGPEAAARLADGGMAEDAIPGRVITGLGLIMSKRILAGGRDSLDSAMTADSKALGWQRVASGTCCAFCAMLAARGAVYGSRQRAGDGRQWHPGCKCTAEPVFSRQSAHPKNSDRYARLWAEVGTGNLNDFRRRLERPELFENQRREASARSDN